MGAFGPSGDVAMQETTFLDDVIECLGNVHLPCPPSNLVQLLSNAAMCQVKAVTQWSTDHCPYIQGCGTTMRHSCMWGPWLMLHGITVTHALQLHNVCRRHRFMLFERCQAIQILMFPLTVNYILWIL